MPPSQAGRPRVQRPALDSALPHGCVPFRGLGCRGGVGLLTWQALPVDMMPGWRWPVPDVGRARSTCHVSFWHPDLWRALAGLCAAAGIAVLRLGLKSSAWWSREDSTARPILFGIASRPSTQIGQTHGKGICSTCLTTLRQPRPFSCSGGGAPAPTEATAVDSRALATLLLLTVPTPATSPRVTAPALPGASSGHFPSPTREQSHIDVTIIASDLTATGVSSGASVRPRRRRRRRRRRTRNSAADSSDLRPCRSLAPPLVVVTSISAPVCVVTMTRTSAGGKERGGSRRRPGAATGRSDARTKPPTVTAHANTKDAIPGVPFIRPIP